MTTLQTAGAAMDSADALKELIARQAVEIEQLKKKSVAQTNLANAQAERICALNQQQQKWYEAVNSLQSERDANALLTTEIEQFRKDAERYRWLRNRPEDPDIYIGVDSPKHPNRWALIGDYADAAIDDAITKELAP